MTWSVRAEAGHAATVLRLDTGDVVAFEHDAAGVGRDRPGDDAEQIEYWNPTVAEMPGRQARAAAQH